MKAKRRFISLLVALVMTCSLATSVTAQANPRALNFTVSEANDEGIVYVTNYNGAVLGMTEEFSENHLLIKNGYAFKDLNKNGKLDAYEDWRLSTEQRADNLSSLMVADGMEGKGIQSIAGLMLYSSHTAVNGEEISDATMTALNDEYLRHILVTSVKDPETAAKWSNNVQAYLEDVMYGIPANNSSDPRHAASSSNVEYNIGVDGNLSLWPSSIGLAATFDADAVFKFGQIASAEYRGLGITTALSPQIDLATDPRWSRFNGTFGEDVTLGVEMARAYVDGFQSTYAVDGAEFGEDYGWGANSVNAMIKHWPGGGAGEGGRDAHYNYGKFAVYPGNNFDEHLLPFTEGAFKLNGKTEAATAVMPYYTISYEQDPSGDNVGNSYSRYIIQDMLREDYKFKGVVCTDWNIVYDVGSPWSFGGMCWGLENDNITDRFIRLLEVGIDQFGGVNAIENIMLAYNKMVVESGATEANAIMKQHAERLLTNMFNTGLFEDPYLDIEETKKVVGNSSFMQEGYETQQKSVVMIKNKNDIISADGLGDKVFATNINATKESDIAASKKLFGNYFGENYVESLDDADAAVIVMNTPSGGSGYSRSDFDAGVGNGYYPITLQYGSYTATTAREQSIAADPSVYWENIDYYDVDNRSYRDKTTAVAANITALEEYNKIAQAAQEKGIPVILYVRANNPMVWSEVESSADAIVVGYSVQTQAALDIITGKVEPSAMLPAQQPVDMATVEAQYEDVGHDMKCYVDENKNTYDFGFGLNYSGIIGVDTQDDRYDNYVKDNRNETPLKTEILKYTIELAEEAKEKGALDGVIETVKTEFNNALANAISVLADAEILNPTVSQKDVNNAQERLITVMHYLEFKGDKTNLNKIIATATAFEADKEAYIPSTYAPFEAALAAARAVSADPDALNEEITTTWKALLEAIANLRLIPNKDRLADLKAQALAIDPNLYTAESIAVLNAALSRATIVLDDPEATENAVKEAEQALDSALAGLVAVAADSNTVGATATNTGTNGAGGVANTNTSDNAPVSLALALAALSGLAVFASKKRK